MLNRSLAPQLSPIEDVDFRSPMCSALNGIPFFHMKDVANDTCRFDMYFSAGKVHGVKSLPSIVNGLLLSGTKDRVTNKINELINGLGGFYESGISMENAAISVYCLRENLIPIMEVLIDAILHANYPEKEVAESLNDRAQQFKISLKKGNVIAQREFQKRLFADKSNYAQVANIEDFQHVEPKDILAFHNANYINGLQKLVLVGNLDKEAILQLSNLLKGFNASKDHTSTFLANMPQVHHAEIPDAMQSAIRVGRILFNKQHPDYLEFMVLNTLLGDYFGSRLMSNIREDKGFTYGIGSNVVEFENTGYFVIGTEVKKEVREAALHEIRFEVERFQNELVSETELNLVRNYMLGQLLKSADGPYAMTDLFLSAEMNGKDLEFYNEAIHTIKSITPERIQIIAKKYLNWEDFTVVSAG
jgi:predicted Zn-dependent peptidase